MGYLGFWYGRCGLYFTVLIEIPVLFWLIPVIKVIESPLLVQWKISSSGDSFAFGSFLSNKPSYMLCQPIAHWNDLGVSLARSYWIVLNAMGNGYFYFNPFLFYWHNIQKVSKKMAFYLSVSTLQLCLGFMAILYLNYSQKWYLYSIYYYILRYKWNILKHVLL